MKQPNFLLQRMMRKNLFVQCLDARFSVRLGISWLLILVFIGNSLNPLGLRAAVPVSSPLLLPMQNTPPLIEAVVVRRGFNLNTAQITGAVRLLTGEATNLNSGATITSALLVPGTPQVIRNGNPTIGQTIVGTGSATPTNWPLTFNVGSSVSQLMTRTDPIALPTVTPPPAPTGTRDVTINAAGQSPGSFATLRNLTLNSNVGNYTIPPGTYGNFTANTGSGFVLGVAGASTPAIYNLTSLNVNTGGQVQIVGPVVLTLNNALNLNGNLGNLNNPLWLTLKIATGGLNLNGTSRLFGIAQLPNGTANINSGTLLQGALYCDRFNLNSGGSIVGVAQTQAPPVLNAPTPAVANQGQTLTVTLTGQNTNWSNGQTVATFGEEISVNGAAYGQPGLVTVTSPTTATVSLTISPTAALAPRTVTISTPLIGSTETLSLSDVFVVKAAPPPGAANATVSTLAGTAGQAGFVDGTGTAARFNGLTGLAVDSNDNVFVADAANHRIRKVDVNGVVTTVAGDGTAGFANGLGTAARFNAPSGLAVDAEGNVYVADTGNHRIRKIDAAGNVTTLAGDGAAGFINGTATTARFNAPKGLALDELGTLYIADTGNAAVRRLAGGQVQTIAGDGTAGNSDSPNPRFNGVTGVVVNEGALYIYTSDTLNHRLRQLTQNGTVITLTGAERGFKDGTASEARFAEPSGLALDGSGNLVVADAINSLVRLVNPTLAQNGGNAAVLTLAGTGERGLVNGAGNAAQFLLPRGVVVQLSSAIIVADTGNQVLRKIVLPPTITTVTPNQALAGASITLTGTRLDGRAPNRNTVKFAKVGGGQTTATVTAATRTSLTVTVPNDAATGPITVTTEGGTASSPNNFTVLQPPPVIADFNPKLGFAGDAVTLTGTNLKIGNDTPAVTFQGQNGVRLPALVTSSTPTQVVATVPNGAVTGTIELTTVGGRASTSSNFIVDTRQNFQITLAPSTVTTLQGGTGVDVVYLTSLNANFTQLAKLTISGLPAGVTASFQPEQITAGANSTLSLVVAGTVAPSNYSFTITATALADGVTLTKATAGTLSVQSGAGQTTLSGRVLNTEREPVIGATVSLDGRTATTDAAGAFLLSGVTAGTNRVVMVDGRTASAPNRTYPVITEPANIVAGQANVVPYIFYLPNIDTQYEVTVVPNQITNVTTPRVNGLQMIIPANANLRNRDGSPVTRVSITPVPIDRTPAPLPSNVTIPLVYTSQPGGAIADFEMPVIYPNLLGLDPNTQVPLYNFNHDTVQWYQYGTGRVSTDGRTIVPEVNPATGRQFGLPGFSWHGPATGVSGNSASPNGNPGSGNCSCPPCARGGNPVDFSSGVKIETAVDVAFGGARGGLAIARTYTSDLARTNLIGRFGRGWKDNFAVSLTGTWTNGGAGRVVTLEQQTGMLFNYVRTDADGALVFATTQRNEQLGDVVRKLTNGTLEYRQAGGQVMRFDATGRLTALVDRDNNTTSLTYTGNNLTTITDAVGRTLTLQYNSDNLVTRVTDPLGRSWQYAYLTFGTRDRLLTVTDPLGHVFQYDYDGLGQLLKITDPRGNLVKQITYDANGRVIKQAFADGGEETYEYSFSGTIVTGVVITDVLGRVMTKRFVAAGYAIEQTDELGQKVTAERDINTNLSTKTFGPCGCADATRKFDSRGNVIESTDRLGQTTKTEYEPVFNNVTKTMDKLNRVTTFGYDSRGNLTSITNALNETTTLGYDGFGQLTSTTDALGHTTQIRYDANGYVNETIDALNHSSKAEYDIVGRLKKTIDPLLRTTQLDYDAGDRLVKTTDPANTSTTFGYDANDNRIRVTDALGRVWTTTYDAKNRMVSATDPLSRVSRLEYNLGDELVKTIAPSGRSMSYTYDARGQRATVTDPLSGVVRFTYDSRGNLITLSDQRGHVTTWLYDELYRPTGMRDPLGRASVIEQYDANDNVKVTVDRLGRKVFTDYDELNRIKKTTYADAVVDYQYDPAGRTTRIDDSQSGFVSWGYDDANRVLSETTNQGAVSYGYNDANQRTAMTALNRAAVNYGYDAAGRLSTITQGAEVFTYSYDTLSRRASLTRPNGVNTSYAYDEVNRLKRLTHANSFGNIEDFQYNYNLNDEISAITSQNSATLLPVAKTASVANQANRISQVGAASYQFDNHGQTTSKTDATGTTNYSWDARGRLTKATLPNGQEVSYGFDALGRRASRSYQGNTISFVYDGQDVVADKAGANVVTDYLNGAGIDDKLRQTSGLGNLYFTQDHLGSTNALTSASGGVVEQLQYEAFGSHNASALTRYTYTGREDDAATGMMYYRARWFDTQQGRFVTEDPIGVKGGLNLYAYVGNNAMNKRDPSGLEAPGEIEMYFPPSDYDYKDVNPASPMLSTSSKFPNMTPAELNRRDYQCKAIKELLRRESLYGTWQASADSSVTSLGWLGRSPLDALNNHSTGNIPYYGSEIDVDWMMDIHKYSGGAAGTIPSVANAAYNVGMGANNIRKWWKSEGWGNWRPGQDRGELLGVGFIENGAKFSDIFDNNWFKEHCPCEN